MKTTPTSIIPRRKYRPRARPIIPWRVLNSLSLLAFGYGVVSNGLTDFSLSIPQITITVGPQNADDISRLPGNQ